MKRIWEIRANTTWTVQSLYAIEDGESIDSTGLFTSGGSPPNGYNVVAVNGALSAHAAVFVYSPDYLGIYPGGNIICPADSQKQFSVSCVGTWGNNSVYFVPTNATWSVSGGATIGTGGLLTLPGTTGVYTVSVTSGAGSASATVHAYSTTVSSNGDGLSDWQNILMGIDPTVMDINKDGYTNAQDIAMGIGPFAPYTPPQSPQPDPSDPNPPVITITGPPGAELVQ